MGRSLQLVATLLVLSGCIRAQPVPPESPVFRGSTMGTTYSIKIAAFPENTDTESLRTEIDDTLQRINVLMSTYLTDSELSRFNRSPANDWFSVSPETLEVSRTAIKIHQLTQGAFDPTVAELVRLWNFGPDKSRPRVPQQVEIDKALSRVGLEQIEVRAEPPALRKKHPDVQLDFSAIAKGYAVDRLAKLLQTRMINDYMIEVGGEMRVSGANQTGAPWRIGIELPQAGQRRVERVVSIYDAGLATSGDYRNFFEEGDKRYSHTIDPRTGFPVDHQLASVSVIADQCMVADAWATALMVLGPDNGYRLAQEQNVAAFFITRAGPNLVRKETAAFTKKIAPPGDSK